VVLDQGLNHPGVFFSWVLGVFPTDGTLVDLCHFGLLTEVEGVLFAFRKPHGFFDGGPVIPASTWNRVFFLK